jgi:hypothetical protein
MPALLLFGAADGWPHDLRRFCRRHALYSALWAALVVLGMVSMALAVRHTLTAPYVAAARDWASDLLARVTA